jgi:toxin secretion/phage lysis holin
MKENIIRFLTGIGAGITTTLLGGWDKTLEILLIFIVIDYITGVAAAVKTKTLKSSTGYEGILKKATMFLVVIIAAQLDRISNNSAGLFRTATAFFFIANDGLSIIENIGELGVKLPAFLTRSLEKLKDTSEKMDKNDDDTKGDGE